MGGTPGRRQVGALGLAVPRGAPGLPDDVSGVPFCALLGFLPREPRAGGPAQTDETVPPAVGVRRSACRRQCACPGGWVFVSSSCFPSSLCLSGRRFRLRASLGRARPDLLECAWLAVAGEQRRRACAEGGVVELEGQRTKWLWRGPGSKGHGGATGGRGPAGRRTGTSFPSLGRAGQGWWREGGLGGRALASTWGGQPAAGRRWTSRGLAGRGRQEDEDEDGPREPRPAAESRSGRRPSRLTVPPGEGRGAVGAVGGRGCEVQGAGKRLPVRPPACLPRGRGRPWAARAWRGGGGEGQEVLGPAGSRLGDRGGG